jgi:asparagine synthase (glutamine-hydrolysing)
MCGICGVYGSQDAAFLTDMCSILKHRGPDSSGTFIDREIMLGVTRLALIDLETGNQPIHNEGSTLWIVYNGEFYNYKEWMDRLKQLGHSFYTRSDTETIIHLYEEFGPDCLSKIRGMFAFAIWDSRRHTLFLARDRFGVKPLYYARFDGGFVFASEIKAFAQCVSHDVDYRALAYYLQLRYLPGDMTLFKTVKKLPAGSYAIITEGGMHISRYYALSSRVSEPIGDPSEATGRLLKESVALRLVSDVPLGVFLSGGLDSSALVALTKHLDYPRIRTYSIGFNDEFDELESAREVANFFETDHHEIVIDEKDAIRVLPEVVYHMDEPVADPASVPTYFLAQQASKDVKGILLGEGSDEVFGGYEQYRILPMLKRTQELAGTKVATFLAGNVPTILTNKLLKYFSLLGREGRVRSMRALGDRSASEMYLELVSVFDSDDIDQALTIRLENDVESYAATYFKGSDVVKDSQLFDLENFLQHLLTRVDKMTMAHSVEAREPFLDNALVEFALSLPSKMRVDYYQSKKVLRDALRDLLPSKVVSRSKNRFFVPIHKWFRSELGEFFWQKMDKPNAAIYRKAYLEKLKSRYDESPLYYARQMWSILNLELWCERYLPNVQLTVPPT